MTRRSAGHAVGGSVFVLVFAVEVVLVIVLLFIEVDIEPVHDGREQVIVVTRGRFRVELIPYLSLARSFQCPAAPPEAAELCHI